MTDSLAIWVHQGLRDGLFVVQVLRSCIIPVFVRFGAYGAETFDVADVGSEVKGTRRNGVQQRP